MAEEEQVSPLEESRREMSPTRYVPTLRRTTPAMLEQVPHCYRAMYTGMEAKIMDMDYKLFCARERLASSNQALERVKVMLHDSKATYALFEEDVRTGCKDCPESCSHSDDLKGARRNLEEMEGLVKTMERGLEELSSEVKDSELENAWAEKELEKIWIEMVEEGKKQNCLQYGCAPS